MCHSKYFDREVSIVEDLTETYQWVFLRKAVSEKLRELPTRHAFEMDLLKSQMSRNNFTASRNNFTDFCTINLES